MSRETEEKLAAALTAETTELIPFLPYLLQDFWELGSDPALMVALLEKHAHLPKTARILDLACGKGAVAVKVAERLGVQVKGVDLLPGFVEYAAGKAREHGVSDLCVFTVGDVNEAAKTERDYDCVIFGAAGNVLGDPVETLDKLKAAIKPGGYILIDECYLPDDGERADIRYNNYEYLTESQWAALFQAADLTVIEAAVPDTTATTDSDTGMAAITARAQELIAKYPSKRELFEGYIRSQQNEYDDLDSRLVGVTWMLRKRSD